MKRRGFTLIELLVVISIIAILSGMLFPVFIAARAAVNRYGAASQLKQLGMATGMYATDNDDSLPPYRAAGWWGPSCPPTACLNPDFRADFEKHGSVAREWYGDSVRDTVYFSQIIRSYFKAERIFLSPGQPHAWVGADRKGVSFFESKNRSYGAQNSYSLNWYLFTNPISGFSTGGGLQQGQVDRTSSTMLLVDGSFYLALPRSAAPLTGSYEQTWIVCEGNYPQYWKNIGNSNLFGPQGPPSDEIAMLLGGQRFGGTLVILNLDGSTKMRTYLSIINEFAGAGKDSMWDPYKMGHEPCPPSVSSRPASN
jgi:prepilin-type N-terminal cleavage/methylation domain-containing protein